MKQGLQLRLSQQLAMTPQLQQAIRLLQLSTLELQQELQQALESNPLLEQIDTHEEIDTRETQDSETLDTADALEQKEMPEELPLDASWDTIYTAGTPSGTSGDYIDDELPVYQGETTQTLQDYPVRSVSFRPDRPAARRQCSHRWCRMVYQRCKWCPNWHRAAALPASLFVRARRRCPSVSLSCVSRVSISS